MHRYRSHTCGELRSDAVGSVARLSGWVHRVRDHGGVLFIDLRDHHGLTQVVADPDSAAFCMAEAVRAEWVIRIDGRVKRRSEDTVNANLPTGEIEVHADELEVLSEAEKLPLPVFAEPDYPEDVRLRYRFLDLRRETLHKNIVLRSAIISNIRQRMTDAGFGEYQTPILTASSPEGARDFLVPSRVHPGKFYALPQAPQQFKQLLMVAGFDRYFQIAPCFRDEDPRADRLPGEFYQLDLEMSFVEQEDVFLTMEPILRDVFTEFAEGKPVTDRFPRIKYKDAIRKYGSDKPDLRNPIEMQAVTEHFAGSGFKIFARMIDSDPKVEVWGIPARTGGSRAFCDRMNSWAQGEGQPGLGYIFWRQEGDAIEGAGPLAKNIGPERTDAIRTKMGLEAGDACFFVAGHPDKFANFAGAARTRVGQELKLVDEDRFEFAWIVDFPMYEWNEDEKKVDFSHNPFSMPQGGLEALAEKDPLTLNAYQYDLVCNGYEIASGAIRNHRPDVMVKAFEIADYDADTLEERFGGLYQAFQFGAPPHGGMAAGIDRIVMLLAGAINLREVTLFPMNQQAHDLLMGAPSEATPKQLRELAIRVAENEYEIRDGIVHIKVPTPAYPEAVAFIDESDLDLVLDGQGRWRAWQQHNNPILYAVRNQLGGNLQYMHRLITNAQPGQKVKHDSGNGLDNRRSNLPVPKPAIQVAENEYEIRDGIVHINVSTPKYPEAVARIDESDLKRVLDGGGRWRAWQQHNNPILYAVRNQPDGNLQYMHRLIMDARMDQRVKHHSRNGLDNRRSNLLVK